MDDPNNADFRAWMQRRNEGVLGNPQHTISDIVMHQSFENERQARECYEGLLTKTADLQMTKDAALREALSRITALEERIRRRGESTREQNSEEAHGSLKHDRLASIVAEDTEQGSNTAPEQTFQAPAPKEQATTSGPPLASTTANRGRLQKQPKPPTHIHRLMKEELDASQQIVKIAFTTHLRILWGAQNANAILPSPPDAQIQAFQSRFTSAKEVAAALRSPRLLIDKSLVRISRDYRSQNIGGKRNAAEFLEEDVLDYMQTYCAKYGLYWWCPNLSESPYSVYNSACRLVALATFKHALSTDAYSFTGVDTAAATDMDILIRIYDHFVHHLQVRLRSKDMRNPGSVLRSARLNTIYRRRNTVGVSQHISTEPTLICAIDFGRQLAAARLKFLRQNGYPRRYQLLVRDPKANSDDELDSKDGHYIIKRRLERSVQAETFFRRLDQMRRTAVLQEGGQWRERPRKVIPDQPMSDFPQLPKAMPVDYYSPSFYNGLPNRQKRIFADASIVALPPDASHILVSGKKHATEKVSDKAFFDNHAEDILDAYAVDSDSDNDQEESLSRDASDMESDHDMDVESEDDIMAEATVTTRDQIAQFVGLVEMAGM